MLIRTAAGILCACALLAIAAPRAWAQLVIGSTATGTGTPAAMYIDVSTGTPTTLWPQTSNTNVNGLAGDNVNGKLYSNDAARLNVWNFGSVGTQPTFIAGIYRTDGAAAFVATGVDSLGWANGHLYGVVSSAASSLGQFRGIYEINTVSDGMPTPHCVATPVYQNSFGTMALGGLDFDPALGASGKFVVTSTVDASSNGGPGIGIYAIDALGDDSVTKIADFPVGQTDWDGLAIGGGKYWLTDYEPGTSAVIKILPYDGDKPVRHEHHGGKSRHLKSQHRRDMGPQRDPGAFDARAGSTRLRAAAPALAASRVVYESRMAHAFQIDKILMLARRARIEAARLSFLLI